MSSKRPNAAFFAACVVLGMGLAPSARAVTCKVVSTGGLMQQPTSHYYLAVYGGAVDVATDNDKFIGRVQYVERPEFTNSGYSDKDYGAFGMIGTKVTAARDHGLFAFIGAGRMQGYVRANDETQGQTASDERRYSLPGPTVAVEYALTWNHMNFAVNHQSFIGYVDKVQTDAYVAWPYNFFQATVGVAW